MRPCACFAPGSWPSRRRKPPPKSRTSGAHRCAPSTVRRGSAPTTFRRAGSPIIARGSWPIISTTCSPATSTRSSAPAVTPTTRNDSTLWGTELDTGDPTHVRDPTRVSDPLRGAIRLLTAAEVPTPEDDALTLRAHAWGIDRTALSRRRLFDDPVPTEIRIEFARLCERRWARIPLQHLTGIAYFRHLELRVGSGVFVPRPETERIVGAALPALTGRSR